jgi:hypothetical protein
MKRILQPTISKYKAVGKAAAIGAKHVARKARYILGGGSYGEYMNRRDQEMLERAKKK